MYIFLISIIVVAFISLCFYKKKFWDNRYLILLIGCGVAFIATLTTNLIMRNNLDVKTEILEKQELSFFSIPDSLISNEMLIPFIKIKNFKLKELEYNDSISNARSILTQSVIMQDESSELYDIKIVVYLKDDKSFDYWRLAEHELSEFTYICLSDSNEAYYVKKKLIYSTNSNWVLDIALPRIKTVRCIYLPQNQYSLIPDKFKINSPH